MSKAIKFKNNIYLNSDSVVHRRESLQNRLDRIGVANRYGSGDTRIGSSSSWNVEHYDNISGYMSSNEQIFESYGSNGIKVKKTGLYIASGVINADLNGTGGSACIVSSEGHLFICDYCGHTSMTSMVVPPAVLRLNANSIIWLAYRFEDPGTTFLTRGNRSYLTVSAV